MAAVDILLRRLHSALRALRPTQVERGPKVRHHSRSRMGSRSEAQVGLTEDSLRDIPDYNHPPGTEMLFQTLLHYSPHRWARGSDVDIQVFTPCCFLVTPFYWISCDHAEFHYLYAKLLPFKIPQIACNGYLESFDYLCVSDESSSCFCNCGPNTGCASISYFRGSCGYSAYSGALA